MNETATGTPHRRNALRVGMIGFGAIGRAVVEQLRERLGSQVRIIGVLPGASGLQAPLAGSIVPAASIEELLQASPDVVIECASHDAVRRYGPVILENGCDLLIASTGALADDALRDGLESRARATGRRVIIPAGAIGAMDILGSLRYGGLASVRYTGVKPPLAWRGTAAESVIDLERVDQRVAFFTGTARDAALAYPKNANVAATIALCGLGFDRTEVTLVADPHCGGNQHSFEATGQCGVIEFASRGTPSSNPRTSSVVAYSICQAVAKSVQTLVVH